ncbi:MAG: CBS domain-containing protein [Candidatus Wildermuthbacteria bacterium]|nr:CBS domain-containing protein [Candidatus Wildermuthbacteria bacterium]
MNKILSDIKNALSPIDRISKCYADGSLEAAFSALQSSHDVSFVFSRDGIFLGFVYPALVLRQSKRYLPGTKVKSVLAHPPHITLSTPLERIAEFMASTGAYTLPVNDESGGAQYAITARSLLSSAIKDNTVLLQVAELLEIPFVPTASVGATVKDVYSIMQKEQRSRVVLVNESGKVEAIIARRDLEPLLLKPSKEQSITVRGPGVKGNTFGTETRPRLDALASSFANKNVVALSSATPREKIVKELLSGKKNSIVLIDGNSRPVGIVSLRLLLRALSKTKVSEELSVAVRNDAKISAGDVEHVRDLIAKCVQKLAKRSPIQRVEARIKESKNKIARPNMFEVLVEILFFSGDKLIAETQNHDLKPAVQEAIKILEKQEQRKH